MILPWAAAIGGVLAKKGGERLKGKTIYSPSKPPPWLRDGRNVPIPQKEKQQAPKKEKKSKFLRRPEKKDQWWKQTEQKPEPKQTNKQWQAGDLIDPSRPNGTPWRHPGMPGDTGF